MGERREGGVRGKGGSIGDLFAQLLRGDDRKCEVVKADMMIDSHERSSASSVNSNFSDNFCGANGRGTVLTGASPSTRPERDGSDCSRAEVEGEGVGRGGLEEENR